MSTSDAGYPFCDRWDAGQVGYIYVTPEAGRKEYGRIWRKKARNLMRSEVQVYDQFLTGDVWYYAVSRVVTCEHCGHDNEDVLDSCGDMYGFEYCKKEAEVAAKLHVEKLKPDSKPEIEEVPV